MRSSRSESGEIELVDAVLLGIVDAVVTVDDASTVEELSRGTSPRQHGNTSMRPVKKTLLMGLGPRIQIAGHPICGLVKSI
jgi:hypothetical protein